MVNEIATGILGPLPLLQHPKSKPFTPCEVVVEPPHTTRLRDYATTRLRDGSGRIGRAHQA
jgi:hypothetical protein